MLRLERTFGVVPAILGTSLLYVLWHTGPPLPLEPDPLIGVVKLLGVGLLYQSVFSTTRNVLIVWPLFHCVGVMIDFAVNIDVLARPAGELFWAIASVGLMVLVIGGTVALAGRPDREPWDLRGLASAEQEEGQPYRDDRCALRAA